MKVFHHLKHHPLHLKAYWVSTNIYLCDASDSDEMMIAIFVSTLPKG
jgi:hypothetical protein